MTRSGLMERTKAAAEVVGRKVVPDGASRRTVVGAVLVVVLVLVACGYAWYRTVALPEDAAFRIGDRVVLAEELEQEVGTLTALYGVQPPTDPAAQDGFRRDAAKAFAVALILDGAARDMGIVIADKAAQDVLDRFVVGQLGEGPEARREFVEALGNAGTSEQTVLGEVMRQLAVGQLLDRVTEGVSVSDEDVTSAFEDRRDQLGTPEQRHLANMVLTSEPAAQEAAARVRAGEPFADVARQVSEDGSTRDAGGDLGVVPAAPLEDGFADVAFAAPVNEVFGPVQTRHGWNVGTVLRVEAPVPAVFEAIREPLRAQLELEESTAVWRDWLADRIRDADVEYADRFRPADPDAPPASGRLETGGAPGETVPGSLTDPGSVPPR